MPTENIILEDVVIKFAGDSGDGMQMTGSQFSNNTALLGNDLSTFPDFPAEIRAPQGTVPGVSGFQIHFSSEKIFTPGDTCDVLVAMNAAALKSNLSYLKKGGIIIANEAGFDSKNLRLANVPEAENPLITDALADYKVIKLDVSKITKEALKEFALSTKDVERAKNMFILGLVYWMYNRDLQMTIDFITDKFIKNEVIAHSNIAALKAGYFYGETAEIFDARYEVKKAKLPPGEYRSITGNTALAYGIVAASELTGLEVFLGTYPITPASDILHELSKYKNFNIITFQAEDEIAGVCAAIGASYSGQLGFTTTSGPGMALKTEAIGLAMMLEIPLVIINVQRGGPSTGLPTKTEQSDLLQAVYGRNGESPIPVIAACSPSDCFDTILEAVRIATEYMTPVIMLSDGYIANGSEPWRFPQMENLKPIPVTFKTEKQHEVLLPYHRNEKGARPWIKPGTPGLEHRIGGLEKQNETGNVSYDPDNHQKMTDLRAQKIKTIGEHLPEMEFSEGSIDDNVLVLAWGGTYGAVKSTVRELRAAGHKIAHIQLRHVFPFHNQLGDIIEKFDQVIIPEINNGQLIKLIQDQYLKPSHGINKMKGLPFFKNELKAAIEKCMG